MAGPDERSVDPLAPSVPLDELARLEPRSLTVLVDVSNKCNLRCRMCYFSYDSVYFRRSVFMTPETFEGIAGTLLPLAHTLYLSAGSEPLTNPHFVEILRIASRYQPPQLKMLTNGLLLTPEISEALIDGGMTQVHVSVDGATRETYEYIRRGGKFETLRKNLRHLADRKLARGVRSPLLQFNIVLMRSNLEELPVFVDLAAELGVEQIACRHLMPYQGLDMDDETTVSVPERANERFHAMLERAAQMGILVTSFPDFYPINDEIWQPPIGTARACSAEEVAAMAHVDRERPFGHVDLPKVSPIDAGESIEIAGWALDVHAIERVEIRREALPEDPAERVDGDGLVFVGRAVMHNGSRPDVAAMYPHVPSCYRAGWTLELRRTRLPVHGETTFRFHAIAHSRSGAKSEIGCREIVFGSTRLSRPHLFCKKPFDNVYLDSGANVYPYPDCQTIDPFGSLSQTKSFREIWFGEDFQELRRRIVSRDPPRMCVTCPDFINRSVEDSAFFEERGVEQDFRLPTGFLDHPPARFDSGYPVVTLNGWALSFAGIERIEILRERLDSDPPSAIRTDGFVLLGRAQPTTGSRPDVSARYGHYPDHERPGWCFDVAREQLPGAGPFRIRVLAWNRDGGRAEIGSTIVSFVDTVHGAPIGAVDHPTSEFIALAHCIDLVGWSVSSSGRPRVIAGRRPIADDPPSAIGTDGYVEIGAAHPHRKRRPDVAARFPWIPDGTSSGWRLRIRRADLPPPGPHEIFVFAETPLGGRVRIGKRLITFTDESAPRRNGTRRARASDPVERAECEQA